MIAPNESLGGNAVDINKLEKLCQRYDAECMMLEAGIAGLEADLEAVKQRHLARLKKQAGNVARAEAELHSAVEQSPGLFKRPRTLVFNGTKIGYTTSIGSVAFEDAEFVVDQVRKHLPDRFDELVLTKHTPRKDSLRTLDEADLAKLGCRVEDAGETVVLKRVTGDVEKLMDKLITKMVTAMVETEGA